MIWHEPDCARRATAFLQPGSTVLLLYFLKIHQFFFFPFRLLFSSIISLQATCHNPVNYSVKNGEHLLTPTVLVTTIDALGHF